MENNENKQTASRLVQKIKKIFTRNDKDYDKHVAAAMEAIEMNDFEKYYNIYKQQRQSWNNSTLMEISEKIGKSSMLQVIYSDLATPQEVNNIFYHALLNKNFIMADVVYEYCKQKNKFSYIDRFWLEYSYGKKVETHEKSLYDLFSNDKETFEHILKYDLIMCDEELFVKSLIKSGSITAIQDLLKYKKGAFTNDSVNRLQLFLNTHYV